MAGIPGMTDGKAQRDQDIQSKTGTPLVSDIRRDVVVDVRHQDIARRRSFRFAPTTASASGDRICHP